MDHKKDSCVVLAQVTCVDGVMVSEISWCDEFHVDRFIKCMGEWEAEMDQLSFRLQISLGQNYL